MKRPTLSWLTDPDCQDPSLVGNKAATLAKLRERGYDVPDGFCLTISALEGDPSVWHEAVVEALRQLRPPWVARSSATAEDSNAHAFPGLFLTVLDLSDVRSVFEAIEQIHRSTQSDTVAVYAAHHHVETDLVRMAVLVQSLVPAEVAGVAFSRDPVTGKPSVVIEANYGLGETVVDGSVTPDSITIGQDGTIEDRHLGSKRQKVVTTTLGTRVRRLDTSELERSASVLSDDAARDIAQTVRDVEKDLATPVDVEWALAGGVLHMLQARPITATPELASSTGGGQ